MSIFGGIGKAIHSPDFSARLQMALAMASGHPEQAMQMRQFQAEQAVRNQELQLRQQAAQRAEEDRNNQIWGAKEMGRSNPEIAAMNPADLSQLTREQSDPYTLSPGQVRNSGGANGRTTTAPTETEQRYNFLNGVSPDLGQGFARREAYGPDMAIAPGGSAITHDAQGNSVYAVQPASMAPQASTGAAPPSTGGGSRNNPGALRYPGSTQFRSFPTEAAGVAAQERQLGRPQYLGTPHSISQIIETYAPRRSRGGDNTDEQVNNYISYVSRRLGVDPNQPLSAADIPRVGQAMREVETGRRPGAGAPSLGRLANAPRQPVQVNSPQEAATLPPGTQFTTPDGQTRVRH